MAMTATVVNIGSAPVDFTHAELIVQGTIGVTGSYVAHGDTLSFSGFDNIKSNEPPLVVQIYETPAAGTTVSGYTFVFVPGTTLANGVVQILVTGTASTQPLQELAAGAYPAGITGAVLNFRAWFVSL